MPLFTQNSIDTDPAARVVWLVAWTVAGTVYRYAGLDADVVAAGQTWLALPSLTVDLGEANGGLSEGVGKITMPRVAPFTQIVLGQRAVARADLYEVNIDDFASIRLVDTVYAQEAIENPLGRRDLISVEVGGLKLALQQVIGGMPCDSTCENIFGDHLCRFNVAGITFSDYQMRVLYGNVVEVNRTGIDTTVNRFFRGWIEKDGVQVSVRDDLGMVSGWRRLVLDATPPPTWNGATSVKVVPGCDRREETCTAYGNIANFNALGAKMPDHNPNIELPQEHNE